MNSNVELIDFFRPDSNRKSLFISNIPGSLTEDDVVDELTEVFSKYGLLYSILVFPTQGQVKKETTTDTNGNGSDGQHGFYAFVNFYAARSAAQAKETLNNILHLRGTECKIGFARRQKESHDRQPLYVTRCYELVNYYLGFNGWSTKIKTLFEDEDSRLVTDHTVTQRYVCLMELTALDLHTDGVGVHEETFAKNDPAGKQSAVCKCKKLSYHRALENVFTRILLVVLGNGKVSVEVDTTLPDFNTDILPDDSLVKVNELGAEPESDTEMEGEEGNVEKGNHGNIEKGSQGNMDDFNLHILQQLEEDM